MIVGDPSTLSDPSKLSREPVFWGEDIPYETGITRQAAVHKLRVLGEIPDQFFYLTHPPVITYGRATNPADLHINPHQIPTIEVPRGGLATYHGPGQLIGYIIMDLNDRANNKPPDIHAYLRAIEEGLINFLQAEYHLPACRREGHTGVWTHGFNPSIKPATASSCLPPPSSGAPWHPNSNEGASASLPPLQHDRPLPRKLASIGVSARKWVTSHGFALNLHPDMDAFRSIIPCGITDAEMTSVRAEHERASRPYQPSSTEDLAFRAHEYLIAALSDYGW